MDHHRPDMISFKRLLIPDKYVLAEFILREFLLSQCKSLNRLLLTEIRLFVTSVMVL